MNRTGYIVKETRGFSPGRKGVKGVLAAVSVLILGSMCAQISLAADSSSGSTPVHGGVIKINYALYDRDLPALGRLPSRTLSAEAIGAVNCRGTGNGYECTNASRRVNNGVGVVLSAGNQRDVVDSFGSDMKVNGGNLAVAMLSPVNSGNADAGTVKVRHAVAPSTNVAMASPLPEPKIYAMMLAGLGLMGFVAGRRQS